MKETEFVPYNLSLKLSKLGFNEQCIGIYTKYNPMDKTELYPVTQNFFKGPLFMSQINSNYPLEFTTAPLWQQAFDWLREEHNLIWRYDVQKYMGSNRIVCYYGLVDDEYLTEGEDDNIKGQSNLICYDTHYEVQLACLEKMISLLETKMSR